MREKYDYESSNIEWCKDQFCIFCKYYNTNFMEKPCNNCKIILPTEFKEEK